MVEAQTFTAQNDALVSHRHQAGIYPLEQVQYMPSDANWWAADRPKTLALMTIILLDVDIGETLQRRWNHLDRAKSPWLETSIWIMQWRVNVIAGCNEQG